MSEPFPTGKRQDGSNQSDNDGQMGQSPRGRRDRRPFELTQPFEGAVQPFMKRGAAFFSRKEKPSAFASHRGDLRELRPELRPREPAGFADVVFRQVGLELQVKRQRIGDERRRCGGAKQWARNDASRANASQANSGVFRLTKPELAERVIEPALENAPRCQAIRRDGS